MIKLDAYDYSVMSKYYIKSADKFVEVVVHDISIDSILVKTVKSADYLFVDPEGIYDRETT